MEQSAVGATVGQAAISEALASLGARLDHVAHAVPSVRAALPLYRDLLGGRPSGGGINPGADSSR